MIRHPFQGRKPRLNWVQLAAQHELAGDKAKVLMRSVFQSPCTAPPQVPPRATARITTLSTRLGWHNNSTYHQGIYNEYLCCFQPYAGL